MDQEVFTFGLMYYMSVLHVWFTRRNTVTNNSDGWTSKCAAWENVLYQQTCSKWWRQVDMGYQGQLGVWCVTINAMFYYDEIFFNAILRFTEYCMIVLHWTVAIRNQSALESVNQSCLAEYWNEISQAKCMKAGDQLLLSCLCHKGYWCVLLDFQSVTLLYHIL